MKLSRRIEEEILLLKIRHGDQEAFSVVYDRYVDQLFRFVSYRVPNEEAAQDIVSDLFLKMWQQLTGEHAKVVYLQAYLYRTARNLVADHYRSAQETLPLEEAEEMPAGADTSARPEAQVSLSDIERGLKRLKPEWQEVIILAYVEGLRHAEIAEIIGKSPSAARVILHRALQELKRIIQA